MLILHCCWSSTEDVSAIDTLCRPVKPGGFHILRLIRQTEKTGALLLRSDGVHCTSTMRISA